VSDWLAAAPAFSVMIELKVAENCTVTVEKLETLPAENIQGEATRALDILCKLADLHGVTLCGYTEPYGQGAHENVRLRVWLFRHGFVPSSDKPDEREFFRAPNQETLGRTINA
jgi:hypothetical protein